MFLFFTQRSIIVKVEYDHGTHCCMSPDGKGYILTQENNQTVNIYKIAKKEDGKLTGQFTMQFPEVCFFLCMCVVCGHVLVCMYMRAYICVCMHKYVCVNACVCKHVCVLSRRELSPLKL